MSEESGQNKDMFLRGIWNNVQQVVGDQGGEIFGRIVEGVSKGFAGDEASKTAGKVAKNVFQVGVATAANVKDFTSVAQESRKSFAELQQGVEPFLVNEFGKGGRGKLMRSKNEVIAEERSRLMGETKFGVYKASAGLVDKAPELLRLMNRKHGELADKAPGQEQSNAGESVLTADDPVFAKLDQGLNKVAASALFDPQNSQLINVAIRSGAPAIQKYIDAESQERFGKASAYGMINEIAEMAASGDGRIGYVTHPDTGESYPLAEYIVEIFKKNQESTKGAPLNDRFRYMPELEAAAKRIAEEIEDNLLDPRTLVSLVGDRKILDEHMRVASPDTVEKELTQMWRVVDKSKVVDAKEFISETAFATKDDFREILKSLPEEEKPFFASLFPDAVLKEMGGLKEGEIDKLKEQGATDFVEHMSQAIETLGKLDEAELQRYGLTAKEGKLVRDLSDAIDEMGAEDVLKDIRGQAREQLTEAVRNGRSYWQDRVSGGKTGKAEAKEAPAEEEGKFASRVSRGSEEVEGQAR